MAKSLAKIILSHPDSSEILSKSLLSVSADDIYEWLKAKYSAPAEKKFVIAKKNIQEFQDNYLDLYTHMSKDLTQVKSVESGLLPEQELESSIRNNKTYRQRLKEYANQEIQIKDTIVGLVRIIEDRAEQIFDKIQENPSDVSKADYVLIQYLNTLTQNIDKLNKVINDAPDQIIQHNITIQVLDQHISIFQDIIKEILSELDIEMSLKFLDLYNEKIKKIRPPQEQDKMNVSERMAETKLLSEILK